MIWFKSCPRCQKGDVLLERDVYGHYLLCLQCGYARDRGNAEAAGAVLVQPQEMKRLVVRSA